MVMTELDMTTMAGVDLVPHPRSLCVMFGVPTVVLTTVSDDAVELQAEAVGETGWVTNPSKPEQLLALVSKVVRT